MRFILKCAFWLGLVAFFLPFGSGRATSDVQISWFGAVLGVQEAVQDLSGFCDRAPRACETGREAALFAGERIGDGIAIAYDFVDDRRNASATPEAPSAESTIGDMASSGNLSTDPVTTGTLSDPATDGQMSLPRAYIAPKRTAAVDAAKADRAVSVIPTPAPRG